MKKFFASLLFLLLLCSSAFGSTTWNPADKGADIVLSGGNLIASSTGGGFESVRATVSKSSGKWYCELTTGSGASTIFVGVGLNSATLNNFVGYDTYGYSYYTDGTKYNVGSSTAYGAAWGSSGPHIIGIALDLGTGVLTFYKDGSSQGTAFTGLAGIGSFYIMVSMYTGSGSVTANFGATAFTYTPPTGYIGFDTPSSKTNALFFAQ